MGCSGSKAVEVNAAQSVANQVPNSLTKPKIAVSNGTIETKALNTMTKAVAVANPLEELTANVADDVAETGETTIVAEAEKIEEIKITEAPRTLTPIIETSTEPATEQIKVASFDSYINHPTRDSLTNEIFEEINEQTINSTTENFKTEISDIVISDPSTDKFSESSTGPEQEPTLEKFESIINNISELTETTESQVEPIETVPNKSNLENLTEHSFEPTNDVNFETSAADQKLSSEALSELNKEQAEETTKDTGSNSPVEMQTEFLKTLVTESPIELSQASSKQPSLEVLENSTSDFSNNINHEKTEQLSSPPSITPIPEAINNLALELSTGTSFEGVKDSVPQNEEEATVQTFEESTPENSLESRSSNMNHSLQIVDDQANESSSNSVDILTPELPININNDSPNNHTAEHTVSIPTPLERSKNSTPDLAAADEHMTSVTAETTEISASVEVTQENVPTTEVKPATPEPQQEETKTTVVESEANAVTTEVEVITTQEEQAVSDTVPEQEAEPQQEAVKETQNKADGEE